MFKFLWLLSQAALCVGLKSRRYYRTPIYSENSGILVTITLTVDNTTVPIVGLDFNVRCVSVLVIL